MLKIFAGILLGLLLCILLIPLVGAAGPAIKKMGLFGTILVNAAFMLCIWAGISCVLYLGKKEPAAAAPDNAPHGPLPLIAGLGIGLLVGFAAGFSAMFLMVGLDFLVGLRISGAVLLGFPIAVFVIITAVVSMAARKRLQR